jgi:hypothetical protein
MKFNHTTNYKNKSIYSDLRRKIDDRQWKMDVPQIKRKSIDNKRSTMKTKEPVEIDEDGFILVTKKNAARRLPPLQQQLQ